MAISVNYEHPVTGAVAPTALQTIDEVTFICDGGAAGGADTAVIVTHNMGLSVADLAAGRPEVILEPLTAVARLSLWVVTAKAADTITLGKAAGAGTVGAAQLRVHIRRPHTIGR